MDAGAAVAEKVAREALVFDKYVVFPRFATYWPKLAAFALVFALVMAGVVRAALAPAPLTPNFRMLYDIFFGSHAEAEARLDAYIRTAVSLKDAPGEKPRPRRGKHKDAFAGQTIVEPELKTKIDPWTAAARRVQDAYSQGADYLYAALFLAGRRVSVNAT